jgi:hypothetical protein
MDFVLEAPAHAAPQADEINVVFCVDISGSMCTSMEVPGRLAIRNSVAGRVNSEFNAERAQQYLPNQRRNITYVTRLQSMQGAVDKQLKTMRCGVLEFYPFFFLALPFHCSMFSSF